MVEGRWATTCPACGERLVPVLLTEQSGRMLRAPVVSAEVPIRMVCRGCRPTGDGGPFVS